MIHIQKVFSINNKSFYSTKKYALSYLSNAIAQRFKMDAVQQRTSLVSHILQTMLPKCHFPTTCEMTFKGRTTIVNTRSETARLTMK